MPLRRRRVCGRSAERRGDLARARAGGRRHERGRGRRRGVPRACADRSRATHVRLRRAAWRRGVGHRAVQRRAAGPRAARRGPARRRLDAGAERVTGRGVVLTGRGVVSPLGVGIDPHWEALCAGRSAVGRRDRLAALGLPATRGAEVTPEAIQPHLGRLPRKQRKLWNRATLLAMLAGALAMEDAGLAPGAGDPRRFGVLLGVNVPAWDLDAMLDYLAASESHDRPGTLDMARASGFCMRSINPLDYSLKTLPNLTAGHLAIANDAQGFCRAVTEGHVGGARAVGDAARLIDEGDLDVALCGGADDQLEELFVATHWAGGVIAADDGRPGLVPGEGSGLLVLEDAEHALARGARVHGELVGFASAAGDGALGGDELERLSSRLTRVIDAVLEEAKTAPDLVSLHGDGITAHDRA